MMNFKTTCLVLFVSLVTASALWPFGSSSSSAANWSPNPEDFNKWMAQGGETITGEESFPELRTKFIRRVKQFSSEKLLQAGEKLYDPSNVGADEYPYFAWIPPYMNSLIPGGPAVTWSTECYKSVKAQALLDKAKNNTVTVTVDLAGATGLVCNDMYLFATLESAMIQSYTPLQPSSHSYIWNTSNIGSDLEWDVLNKGIRIFKFQKDELSTIGDLLATAMLFISEATVGVPDGVAAANIDFLKKYANVTMKNRTTNEIILDENQIHSGDFLGIIRLDGLDPMLAWAMGSTTGHTTVALWIEGELYITESTAKDSYWPVNGIQKTPYRTWLAQAKAADYQVVHAPLSPEMRAKFNESAAIDHFLRMEGVDYGYHNMFWGWIDTIKDNYPCTAPDFKSVCLQWEHIEIIFGLGARLAPAAIEQFVNQAWNLRLGTSGLSMAGLLREADTRKINPATIPTIVEQDKWLYNTTRYGQPVQSHSYVCCAYVCSLWKAAGLYAGIDDDIQCTEQTNFDDYSQKIFDSNYVRPSACVAADPSNPLCQLEGKYTLELNGYNTREPYKSMDQTCPSEAPKYDRPSNC